MSESGLYNYIKDIDQTDRFIYFSIVIGSVVVATRIGNHGLISASGVIGLIVGLIVVHYLKERWDNTGDTFLTTMTNILNSDIMKPSKNRYLGNNSELVIFLDDHREYYQYNPVLWRNLVRNVDNFLHVSHDIEVGTERYNLDYDQLKETKRKILNQFQSYIHTIPHMENSNDKFHRGMERLQRLLNYEIDIVHQLITSKNSKGVDTSSAFHYKNHPTAYEHRNLAEGSYMFFNA